jgi:hypothetical protein
MSPLISNRRPRDQTERGRLAEEAIERYVDWREESATVNEAYAQWSTAPEAEGALAFAAYRAAVDREECAATLYGTVIDRLGRGGAGASGQRVESRR